MVTMLHCASPKEAHMVYAWLMCWCFRMGSTTGCHDLLLCLQIEGVSQTAIRAAKLEAELIRKAIGAPDLPSGKPVCLCACTCMPLFPSPLPWHGRHIYLSARKSWKKDFVKCGSSTKAKSIPYAKTNPSQACSYQSAVHLLCTITGYMPTLDLEIDLNIEDERWGVGFDCLQNQTMLSRWSCCTNIADHTQLCFVFELWQENLAWVICGGDMQTVFYKTAMMGVTNTTGNNDVPVSLSDASCSCSWPVG